MVWRINPMAFWADAYVASVMAAEAQKVFAMQVMGLARTWPGTGSENTRIVSEKFWAMSKSTSDATRAMMCGGGPDQIFAAALKPYGQTKRGKARPLAKSARKAR
jgi:hypothetical protein